MAKSLLITDNRYFAGRLQSDTDQTYQARMAKLQPYYSLVQADKGTPKLTLKSTVQGGTDLTLSKFILLGDKPKASEKIQPIETFGATFIWVLGAKMRPFSFNILLLNDINNNWKNKLLSFWDRAARASQAVASHREAILTYDGTTVIGQLVDLDAMTDSQTQMFTMATITMILTRTFPDISNGPNNTINQDCGDRP